MANVEAAKKTAAAAPDRAGVIQILRDGFPDMFGSGAPDEMVAEYFGDLLEGGVEDEPADPMAPAADTKPAPAVPLFTSAEDVEKVAGATAPVETAEAAELKKQIETLTASVKALEARGLSGTIITASAADRSGDAPAETPGTSNPHDFVGGHLVAFKAHTAPSHKAAIAYLEKAHASGNRITYRDAVVAVTRKTS